jgi:colicin import membrane protein
LSSKFSWNYALLFSAFLHVVFFIIITSISANTPQKVEYPSVVHVDLVEMSASVYKEEAKEKKDEVKKKNLEKPIKKKAKKETKKKALKSPIKSKKPKKISNKVKPDKTPPKQIQKKDEVKKKNLIADAIKSVEKKLVDQNVKEQTKPVKKEEMKAENHPAPDKNDKKTNYAKSKEISDSLTNYKAEIAYRIQKNWAFPKQFQQNDNLETTLVITILKNGKIDKIWFEKRSGNSYLDESAYRAVIKSDPLPPIPDNIGVSFYNIGFKFTPLGLN